MLLTLPIELSHMFVTTYSALLSHKTLDLADTGDWTKVPTVIDSTSNRPGVFGKSHQHRAIAHSFVEAVMSVSIGV